MSKDMLVIRVSGILTDQRLEALQELFKVQLPDDQPFILIDESVEDLDVLYGLNDEEDKAISYGEGIVGKVSISKESVDAIIYDIVEQITVWRNNNPSKHTINSIDYNELKQIIKILHDYNFMAAHMFEDLNRVINEHKEYVEQSGDNRKGIEITDNLIRGNGFKVVIDENKPRTLGDVKEEWAEVMNELFSRGIYYVYGFTYDDLYRRRELKRKYKGYALESKLKEYMEELLGRGFKSVEGSGDK